MIIFIYYIVLISFYYSFFFEGQCVEKGKRKQKRFVNSLSEFNLMYRSKKYIKIVWE